MTDAPTDFELEQWLKEAKRLITCTGCYGVGQKHVRATDTWNLCETCNGSSKAIAEPHVVRLVEEVQRLRVLVEAGE